MRAAGTLKNFIMENGTDALEEKPFEAYQALLEDQCDPALAHALLYSYVCGIPSLAKTLTGEELTNQIRIHCDLGPTAEVLSALYQELSLRLQKAYLFGLHQITKNGYFSLEWAGSAFWYGKCGVAECSGHALIDVHVVNRKQLRASFGMALKKNPYLDEETLLQILNNDLNLLLDADFEKLCRRSDKSGLPVAMETNFKKGRNTSEKFCREHGLSLEYYEAATWIDDDQCYVMDSCCL